jgi:hypothetical protein
MSKVTGVLTAGLTAMVIGFAAAPAAQAAPALTATGGVIRDVVPDATEEVRWRGGGRGFRHGGWHGRRFHHRRYGFHRPYYRPAFYGGYGGCFWRPARTVWTPYGWRWRPAARVCRW